MSVPDLLFADALVESGTIEWVNLVLPGRMLRHCRRSLPQGCLSNSDSPNAGVAEYTIAAIMNVVHGWEERSDDQRNARWNQKVGPKSTAEHG